MHAMPPYGLWETPPLEGCIPPHRTDVGTFLTAEMLGARYCVLVKDEHGLLAAAPKKPPAARFIPEIEVGELQKMDFGHLPVERAMLDCLSRARSTQEVLLINGLKTGDLTRALRGENPGTCIFQSHQ